jgi:hypothetical protein
MKKPKQIMKEYGLEPDKFISFADYDACRLAIGHAQFDTLVCVSESAKTTEEVIDIIKILPIND